MHMSRFPTKVQANPADSSTFLISIAHNGMLSDIPGRVIELIAANDYSEKGWMELHGSASADGMPLFRLELYPGGITRWMAFWGRPPRQWWLRLWHRLRRREYLDERLPFDMLYVRMSPGISVNVLVQEGDFRRKGISPC